MILVLIGFGASMKWSLTPGPSAKTPITGREGEGVRVEVVAHPLCPCSSASLQLLKRATKEFLSGARVTAYFVGNEVHSKNTSIARTIPHATVKYITETESAQRFGEATSGQVFVWKQGQLVFSGGLTDSRGEEAAGSAYQTLLKQVEGQSKEPMVLPTFGCPVQTP